MNDFNFDIKFDFDSEEKSTAKNRLKCIEAVLGTCDRELVNAYVNLFKQIKPFNRS